MTNDAIGMAGRSWPQRDMVAPRLVSIVIRCYRGAKYLGEAVASCLNQTYSRVEVVIVDDASPDASLEIARRFEAYDGRVRVLRNNRNAGSSRAVNSGFAACHGEYMARLSQDDRFRRDAIQIMKDSLDRQRDLGLVCCDVQTIDARSQIVGRREVSPTPEGIFTGQFGPCVMWRRRVWDEVGEFDPAFDPAEDYEYVLRAARHFKMGKAGNEAPFFARVDDARLPQRPRLRQILAIHRARARHCQSPLGALRHLSEGFFEASYARRAERRYASATRYSASAIACWPFSMRNYRSLAGVGRDAIRHRLVGAF